MLLVEDYLPAILTAHPMADEEFAALCSQHPDLFFEMTAEGELIVMAPNCSPTVARPAPATAQFSPNSTVGHNRIDAGSSQMLRLVSFFRTGREDRRTPPGH